MSVFITAKVFNPDLCGKAVRVSGHDINGEFYNEIFLVKKTNGEYITLVDRRAKLSDLHMESFVYGKEALKITVLEENDNE